MTPVYYCGPAELAKKLKPITLATSSSTVKFSFSKEHFVSLDVCQLPGDADSSLYRQ